MSQAAPTATTNMEKIKAGIWDIHEGVSAGQRQPAPEQDNIMKGTLPRFKYVANLGQRYLLQREFEVLLAKHRSTEPFLSSVVTDEQFHAEKSAIDLRFFQVDPAAVQMLPTTKALVDFFAQSAARDTRLLVAVHYVIEGSNNGAMFIAKAVKQAYGLDGTDGTFHLQPYGPAIRDKWKAFAEAFNQLEIPEALMEEMVRVGRETFHHMNRIADEAHALPEAAR